jgi:hypothetical protein
MRVSGEGSDHQVDHSPWLKPGACAPKRKVKSRGAKQRAEFLLGALLPARPHQQIEVVSEVLGHASVAFTLQTYGHVQAEMRKPARDAMERLFAANPGK